MKTVFIKNIPENIEEDTIYISEEYHCAIHRCACGCGCETVMTINDGSNSWEMIKNGDGTVTFSPSIGNFNFPCKSHYFIRNNEVVWA